MPNPRAAPFPLGGWNCFFYSSTCDEMAARFQINQVLPEIPRPALPAGTQAPFDGLKCKEIRKSALKRAVFIQRVPELTRRDGI